MVKKLLLLVCLFIWLFGCQGTGTGILTPTTEESKPNTTVLPSVTPVPTQWLTLTSVQPSPTATSAPSTKTAAPTATETVVPTDKPTIPPETRLKLQCLDVALTLPNDFTASGIMVLGEGIGGERPRYDTLLLDMETGQVTQIVAQDEFQFQHVISSDGTLMAYESHVFDTNGNLIKYELVIATADGQRQKVIPWEEKWLGILGWTNDQRLLLSYDEPAPDSGNGREPPTTYLVMDPFNGESQVLYPDFPGFLDMTPLPWGWYDPTLTRVIYPHFIGDDEEMYTYALWDMTKQQVVTSLENIYANFTVFRNGSPMPRWSSDGSRFMFVGKVRISEDLVEFELYQVSRDGQVEQLTQLTPIAVLQGLKFSLSPDGQKIAMYLDTWYDVQQSHVALLDMDTLEVTDYCIPARWGGGGTLLPSPIWSPDGKQILVVDWYEEGHNRVILVDIAQGFAAQIAEDMQPLGWMVAP